MHPKNISILDYTYPLPPNRIAASPLSRRDDSKLLVYKDGDIKQGIYKNLAEYLPENSLLVFNNTKVIQARILFQKDTGAFIEIFCLEPFESINEYSTIMNKKERIRWKCLIGGASKWKEGDLSKYFTIEGTATELQAKLVEKLPDAYVAEFSWQPAHFSFAEIIEQAGNTPLPPYIKRDADQTDKERYQTIYARYEGSVAAPTAGLHFTPEIFSRLDAKGINRAFVTLHVGAGTFKPVKSAVMANHEMHSEWIDVDAGTLARLIAEIDDAIIAVGTTSLRTIESLYWMGVKSILSPHLAIEALAVKQWEVYDPPLVQNDIPAVVALSALLNRMKRNACERLIAQTQILLAPGYRFRIATAIFTNFHQPGSTLLLLVAAAIGEDWKKVYGYALKNDFRFLSYGDGSLLYLSQPSL